MHIDDFNYSLPPDRIATHPRATRGVSKLLVMNRRNSTLLHKRYNELIDFIQPGDLVILNNTKVIKARMFATSQDGKQKEFLLLERHTVDLDTHRWRVLYRGKIKIGQRYQIQDATLHIENIEDGGIAIISSDTDLLQLSEQTGHVPLPPYIHREDTKEDAERYQTEFAREPGSVAAPTASLNFTKELIDNLEAKGVHIDYLTLHVGLGTFLPIRTDSIKDHKMHSEYFRIPVRTVKAIQEAKSRNKRVVAVGTTVTRTLEYCADDILNRTPTDLTGEADIFIYPGYKFKVVDTLLTNFHAPKTTVLMLAAAFAGWDNLSHAYNEALARDYAFLSYGDSMLILT